MGHQGHEHRDSRKLGVALLLNLLFVVLEVAGGLWTNSVAILTDALHDGGDCISLGLAWYLERVAGRRADARFTYGYRRFSNLGALLTGVVLTAGLVVIGWNAVQRLREPESVYVPGMLGLAVLGILLNGAAAWKLHGGHSLNERVASWHLLEDTLGWAAVLVGSGVMLIWDLPIIDPLLALMIAAFVLWNVVRNLKKVALVFLQSTPAGFDGEKFARKLSAIKGVVGSHHTHTWTLDGESHVFSTHLVMRGQASRPEVLAAKRQVHVFLRDQEFAHITIEVELEGEECGSREASESAESSDD